MKQQPARGLDCPCEAFCGVRRVGVGSVHPPRANAFSSLLCGQFLPKKKQREPVEIPTDYPAMPKHFSGEYAETWGAAKVVLQDNGYPVRSSDVFSLEDLVTCIVRVRHLEAEVGSGRDRRGREGTPEKACVAGFTGISSGNVARI